MHSSTSVNAWEPITLTVITIMFIHIIEHDIIISIANVYVNFVYTYILI